MSDTEKNEQDCMNMCEKLKYADGIEQKDRIGNKKNNSKQRKDDNEAITEAGDNNHHS